ncbi:lasso peptide biosynthesis B2 protein [Spirosoma sp. 209]|uniref:lasso peptide biosynthesis B2 protein n=1 Tax=Spirosoma sp. 209 TaxID=1955701 RepID=UPI00098D4268|nr:lasso peptide biosynthesis B2 protein [Spirosoma sp. 209]
MKTLSKLRLRYAKISSLRWTEKILLIYVLAVLILVKVLILLFPVSWFITPRSAPASHTSKRGIPTATMNKRVWAVNVLSTHIPLGFTCLIQALAAKWLLKNQPHVRVHIGVRSHTADGFSAHAWVTYQSVTILGEQPNLLFEPILAWT